VGLSLLFIPRLENFRDELVDGVYMQQLSFLLRTGVPYPYVVLKTPCPFSANPAKFPLESHAGANDKGRLVGGGWGEEPRLPVPKKGDAVSAYAAQKLSTMPRTWCAVAGRWIPLLAVELLASPFACKFDENL